MQTSESAKVSVSRRLEYKLFKGVSIQLNNESDVDAAVNDIANMAKVKNVWPVRTIPKPNDTIIWTANNSSSTRSMMNIQQSTNDSDAFLPHVMTQVDRLHAKGATGKGTKIAVIDTGIDYLVSIPHTGHILPKYS